MKLALAQFILQACENADTFFENEEVMPELYEDYTNPRKLGKDKTELAIICGDVMPIMAAIACEAAEFDSSEYWDSDLDLEDIRHLQYHSFGMSKYILY